MEKILYEYTFYFYKGYTFKKQICINDNKKIIFHFIVNDNFCDDLLLSNVNSDFKDNILNIKIKEYLLNVLGEIVQIKTLGLAMKGLKGNIEILKSGIKLVDKVFKLKNNDYDKLENEILNYIEILKHQWNLA